MTIKELAYSAQQHLQACTGSTFKRAHIYELLAATFGFNSYAAFSSEAVFTRWPSAEYSSQHNAVIRRRCVELGYSPETAEIVSSRLHAFVSERQIDVVRLSDLVATLRDEPFFFYEYLEWECDQQGGDVEEMLAHTWLGSDGEASSLILLDELRTAASKGNALAHYALALIHDPGDQPVGSAYWYSQGQQGRVLTGVEKEWADSYAQQLAKAEKYEFHLREAARLRAASRLSNGQVLLDLVERFINEGLGCMEDGRY
jgi:hypothetical protein